MVSMLNEIYSCFSTLLRDFQDQFVIEIYDERVFLVIVGLSENS